MTFNILPCEVKELIFSFLLPEDLFTCMGICREWRGIVNSERLWKKTLLLRNIDFNDYDKDDIPDLFVCKHALLWKQHSETCTGWYLNTFRQKLIPYETSEELTCCRIFVFKDKMALISDKIQVFSFSNDTFKKENIQLPFIPHAVTMNNKYVVCTFGNIVLIFKKDQVFRKYCAFALQDKSSLLIQTVKLKSFVESKKKFGPYIKVEALVGEYLWISYLNDTQRFLNVVNLKNLTVTNTNIIARLLFITKHRVIVSTQKKVQVFNFEGQLQYVVTPESEFNCFRATDYYLVTYMNSGENTCIWTIDGKFVWRMAKTCYQFRLDPTRHLLYTCSGSNNPCKLSAYSLKTGALAWFGELPGVNSSEVDDMFLVCDKFLIIDVYMDSPSPAFHFGFIYDLDTKQLLYKADLRGFTMHVSNNLWVQKRQNDLIVNIY